MNEQLRLLCVLAHPDDESLGNGGILARYAAEGVETHLVTATRGERGWNGPQEDNPGLTGLGQIREAELEEAARKLGIRTLHFLDYIDGDLDQAEPSEAIGRIVRHIRRVRPHVVVTFDPAGAYGHPDHIAICQFTTAATACAADPAYDATEQQPYRVAKLYYMAVSERLARHYQAAFGDLVMPVDGVNRGSVSLPDWAITTRIQTVDYWKQVWEAVACHQSQLPNYEALKGLPEEVIKGVFGLQEYYRAYSLVNGGRAVENDLFAGLR